ncbi:hypothetical protein Cni_G05141 [Canna indica]|uniref:Uncharacterized protein n=1 Tax=Canna indica TaxID=4628 RepID=A0AAQ3JWH7_9LILI|nr:hypothetical protein Cni_G05141 [Canna indica]
MMQLPLKMVGLLCRLGMNFKPPQMCTKPILRFDCKQSYNMWEQLDDDAIDGLLHSVSSFPVTTIDHSASAMLRDVSGILLLPKKPQSETSGLSPWHTEMTMCGSGLQYMSKAELDWAQAVICLIEKQVFCKQTDVQCQPRKGPPIARPQPRLALTTRLMQRIFPPMPSRFLKANATASHATNVYILAKLALIDACKLLCLSGDNPIQNLADGNICKEGYSTLYLGLECRFLEKHATIIRFARFHEEALTKGTTYGMEKKSIPTANCEAFCPRHLTVVSMPQKLPRGRRCLLL